MEGDFFQKVSLHKKRSPSTPVRMTDEDGYIVWLAMIEPFGKTAVHPVSEIENNFRFPGQYFDAETGLHYNYHRYYDPDTGRYLTPDPIGLTGGLNLYTYTHNNPINLTDVKGLLVAQAIGGIVGMSYGIYAAYQSETSILQGGIIGLSTGVLSTFGIVGLSGWASGALMGLISGGAANIAGQLSNPCLEDFDSFDWDSFLRSLAAGAIGGTIGGGLSSVKITQVIKGPLLDSISYRPVFSDFGQEVISSSVGGVTAGWLDVKTH